MKLLVNEEEKEENTEKKAGALQTHQPLKLGHTVSAYSEEMLMLQVLNAIFLIIKIILEIFRYIVVAVAHQDMRMASTQKLIIVIDLKHQ